MPSVHDPTAELLARARAGDGAAFAALVDPLAPRLLLFLRARAGAAVGADCAPEDLLQATLLRAWQALGAFEPRGAGALHRWLVSLAHGIVADRVKYQRAKGRGAARHLESLVDSRGGGPAAYDPRTSITQVVARREAFARAEAALAELDPAARRVVEGHVFEGRSLAELASELGLAKSTVWQRLHDAMAALRARLEET